MNSKIQAQFDELEATRQGIFNELKKYPDDVLNKKPSPEAWSVLQVIDHLVMSEELSLKYLEKKTLDTGKASVAGLSSWYRFMLVKIVFAWPRRFPAPNIMIPHTGGQTLESLENRWAAARKTTFQLLDKLSDADLKKEIWKHALAGKMSIAQMYAFFKIHLHRHRQQIERTLKAVNQ